MEPQRARGLRIGETVALAAPAARVLAFDAAGARLERTADIAPYLATIGATACAGAAGG
jgi:hypothetical protein